MKKPLSRKFIKRKKSIDNNILYLLSLQLPIFYIFLNSYEYFIDFLPQGIYFCPSRSVILLMMLLLSLSFLIMSIGYSTVSFSSNNSASCSEKRSSIAFDINEHSIQRSKVFLIHGFFLLCVGTLIFANIHGVIQSNSF